MRNPTPPGRYVAGHWDAEGNLKEVAVFPYLERAAIYIEMLRMENGGEGTYKIRQIRE